MSSGVPPPAAPAVSTASASPQSFSTFTADEEVRWSAWLARGRQHHQRSRQRLRVGLLVGAAVAVVAIAMFGAPNTW